MINNNVTWCIFFYWMKLLNVVIKFYHNLSNFISVKCYKSTDDKNHHSYNCKLIMNKLQCYECWDSIPIVTLNIFLLSSYCYIFVQIKTFTSNFQCNLCFSGSWKFQYLPVLIDFEKRKEIIIKSGSIHFLILVPALKFIIAKQINVFLQLTFIILT
jgi:hypothetical protein